ncbi:hypothetical protein IFM89_037719 [Coptis chinensis]|uniref:BED-type domain-containing protein n=1 Tax=Coptis chinensis TaxID=261450 RepID=A0A835IH13_9MAGN|nr:hypothetical protein IFM89_037719 [Coptis chinensis]
MIRKKDPFWEYGENMKGRFQCKFCQKDFPGGIARLKSHLSRLRGRDVAICHSVPEDVRVLALQDIRSQEEYLNKRRRLSTFMIAEENGVKLTVTPTALPISPTTSSPYSSPRLHQTELLAVCSKEDKEAEEKIVKDKEPGDKMVKDNESVDKMVAQAFMMNGIAANVVKSPSFISMIKAIAEYGSGYSLPSCATLSTKLLRDVRKEVNEYVSAIKASWSLTGCTLMSDTWTDSENHSFITLIAYSPKGAVFLKSFESTDSTIAGDFLEDILLSIVDEIGSENVVQIIVNKVSCGEYAMDLVAENYPHIYRTKCASHGFQQMLEDIYENVEWIQSAFDDAKSIVDYLYKYPLVLKSMQVHKPDKELKRPCETTCASYFVMLQSLIDFEDCLRTIVVSPEWSVMNESKTPRGNTIVQLIQSLDFWNRGKEVIASLEPLISVLHLVDGEGSTAGYLYEAMERVRVEFKQRCSNDESKSLKLLKIFDSRRGDIVHKIHAAASFLNPSLMYDGKIKYEQPDIRDGMNYVVEHMRMESLWKLVYLLEPAPLALMLTAIAVTFFSAFRALSHGKEMERNRDFSESSITLDGSQALMIPLLSSCSLLLMFYLFSSLSQVLTAFTTAASVFSLFFCFSPFVSYFNSKIGLVDPFMSRCCSMSFTRNQGLLLLVCVGIVGAWLVSGHWVLNNLLGISICIAFVSHVRLPNIKICALLLCCLFFYDIFWVYFSERLFGTNVMVAVATQKASNPVHIVANSLNLPGLQLITRKIELPVKIVFPRNLFSENVPGSNNTDFMMLGLGDMVKRRNDQFIGRTELGKKEGKESVPLFLSDQDYLGSVSYAQAIPGMLLAFVLCFDHRRSRESVSPFDLSSLRGQTYIWYALPGYAIGLVVALATGTLTHAPQPALLFLVPSTLGPIIFVSWIRKELMQLWEGTGQIPNDKDREVEV